MFTPTMPMPGSLANGRKSDLLVLFEQAIDALAKGIGELLPRSRPKGTRATRARA
jgi:hypothetical protein